MGMTSAPAPRHNAPMSTPSLKRYAWLSIAAALTTILLKTLAWWLTGSVGLLSDALESVVNLAGAMMALAMITLAEQPADRKHAYGHGKAEYFSGGFEGLLIVLAAGGIAFAALDRLWHPVELSRIDLGLVLSLLASLVNFAVARVLLSAGRKHRSLTLEADARHLMTDVWTSAAVIAGILGIALTGWLWLDPVLALIFAANIAYTGWTLLRRSAHGLMDAALPEPEHRQVIAILDRYRANGVDYHALRTRESGAQRFVEVHLLFPGEWTVRRAHDLSEQIEHDLSQAIQQVHVLTHLEPSDDPRAHDDPELDR